MANDSFSARHGYVWEKPILYRDALPADVRPPLLELMTRFLSASDIEALLKNITAPYYPPNLLFDVESQFEKVQWFYVYELLEDVARILADTMIKYAFSTLPPLTLTEPTKFIRAVNKYFVYAGIGWRMNDQGIVVSRGDENFEQALQGAGDDLQKTHRPAGADHLKDAQRALSQRPQPNTAGAITESVKAVESLLHHITGEKGDLGLYLGKNRHLFHPALREGISKLYGFASDTSRHGHAGDMPSEDAARFIMTTCSALCSLLSANYPHPPVHK